MEYNIDKIRNFLNKNLNKQYNICALNKDASLRQYYRVTCNKHNYILMDSSKEQKAFHDFINITNLLETAEFSVPEIYLVDYDNYFMLIEDFGQVSFNQYLNLHHHKTDKLYKLALDNLIKISKVPVSDLNLNSHDIDELQTGIKLFQKYYLKDSKPNFLNLTKDLFLQLDFKSIYLTLRDFHADNLIFLKERNSYNQIGLLDYQDASKGFLSYDLISLIQDARRWVDFKKQAEYFDYFTSKLQIKDLVNFKKEYEILSFQRNARILGLFTKLVAEGKNNYSKYLGNVEKYFMNNLNRHNLAIIKQYITN
jgi:aminoglycoside/choline kinase family phosphotransferase